MHTRFNAFDCVRTAAMFSLSFHVHVHPYSSILFVIGAFDVLWLFKTISHRCVFNDMQYLRFLLGYGRACVRRLSLVYFCSNYSTYSAIPICVNELFSTFKWSGSMTRNPPNTSIEQTLFYDRCYSNAFCSWQLTNRPHRNRTHAKNLSQRIGACDKYDYIVKSNWFS